MRKLLVIGVAITMLTVFLPVSTATHFSVGAETAIGNAPSEDRNNPSVEGDSVGDSSTPYGVGTSTSGCYDAQATISPGQVMQAATTDGFCGDLVYNEGTSYEQISPPDQDYLSDEIGTLDVQRSWRTPTGLATCLPMCDDSGDAVPVQSQIWDAVHEAGSQFGLTDGPNEADEKEGHDCEQNCRFSTYAVDINHAHPNGIVQRNLDVWEMNGWIIHPVAYGGGFIGFVTDSDGNVVDDERLETIVENSDADPDAVPTICGFTPDRNFQSTGDEGFCESQMFWVDGEAQNSTFTGYKDECHSPTYVCGPTTGGYWDAEAVGLVGAYGSRYQGEHMRWHWMIAPHEAECFAMEPGPDLLEDSNGLPYLAHDLDVYTPPHRVNDAPYLLGTDNFYSIDDGDDGYVTAFTKEEPTVPLLPEDEIDQAVATADAAAQPVRKSEVLEPNHVGAEGSAIDDNSRVAISEDRTLGLDCNELSQTETDATNDPWVNYLDSGVTDRGLTVRDPVVEDNAPDWLAAGGVSTDSYGLYGNNDASQDEDNDPTPDVYSTSGNVGMFADKNDDGDYDVVVGPNNAASGFGAGVYEGDRISDVGAYPMLWDMFVKVENGNAQVAENRGCTGGPGDKNFAGLMQDEGYGPNTGLAQAIYLQEPTAFYDVDATIGNLTDPEVDPYPAGNNIYVLGNHAVKQLWDGEVDDGTDDFTLSEEVDTLVEGLQDHVGATGDDVRIAQPGENLGLASDFNSQCGTDTGGFSLDLSFVHNCETGCSGDTIATMYSFEATNGDGSIGGTEIPAFKVNGDVYDFGDGDSWFDIDPFDGDPDRNEERQNAPPSAD